MRYFCPSAIFGYLGGQMGDKMGDNLQISKLKIKNLQKLAQFLMLEIKRFTIHICRYYAFLCKKSLADAEVTICKYKSLIISVNTFVLGCLKWLRGTVGGRKIGKNLQIWLPSKKENANICKIDFPVLCTFTLFNADFCRFLQSLWSELRLGLMRPSVMFIVISTLFEKRIWWQGFIVGR